MRRRHRYQQPQSGIGQPEPEHAAERAEVMLSVINSRAISPQLAPSAARTASSC